MSTFFGSILVKSIELKKTRPRIKTTKYSVFNNFQNLREHNPYTTLEPSFECSFSTPTS